MENKPKVLILGSGFAGQGHADAFRRAGAEVVGIVSRTKNVVEEVASKLDIPYAGTDWDNALEVCRPDIVSIATPGGAHFSAVMSALEFGCHVYCDKPLAESGERARMMYEKAEEKQLKTAFAASYRYMQEVLHAKRLIEEGVIGEPQEVEFISHFDLDPYIPLGWSHKESQGGGRLNNNFTHLLSIVTHVVGDKILSICGDVRNDMGKAPIVDGVHNFMTRRDFIPKDLDDPNLEWGETDVEWSYTVMAKIESRSPAKSPVSVMIKHGGLQPRFNEDHLVFYGSEGALYIKGHYGKGPLYLKKRKGDWEELPLPKDIQGMLPDIEDDTLRNWAYLAAEFVKDIKGIDVEPYQTFKDGCRYQEIIDIIRKSDNWTDVSRL
jgi:predicted dehydrogenase